MSAQFLVDFEEAVRTKVAALAEPIVNGAATDWPDYRRRCAEVKALKDSVALAREVFKKGERDDE